MEKRLKIGLICMLLAVVILPVAFLFRNTNPTLTIGVVVLAMILEIIGLVCVVGGMLKNRRK